MIEINSEKQKDTAGNITAGFLAGGEELF